MTNEDGPSNIQAWGSNYLANQASMNWIIPFDQLVSCSYTMNAAHIVAKLSLLNGGLGYQ